MENLRLRPGSVADRDHVLDLFDQNVEWLVARGRAEQWGATPWSRSPERRQQVEDMLSAGSVLVAEDHDGRVGAVSVVADRPSSYVPTVDEPERFVRLLIVSPLWRGRNAGGLLLDRAKQQAVADGVGLLRVDCWAGADGALVAYYSGQGFTPDRLVTVRPGTAVQVLTWRPGDASA